MATSNPSLRIELDPALLEQLRALDKAQRREIGQRIEEVRRCFGHPHMHHGSGIRNLGGKVYECRMDLHRRLVFTSHKDYLYFHRLANQNEVRRFLRSL